MIIVPSGNQGRPIKGVAHCGCALCLIERLLYVALRARFPGPRALVVYGACPALMQLKQLAPEPWPCACAELGLRALILFSLSLFLVVLYCINTVHSCCSLKHPSLSRFHALMLPRGHARPSSHITQDALYLAIPLRSQRVLSNPADTGREPCDAGRSWGTGRVLGRRGLRGKTCGLGLCGAREWAYFA